MNSAKLKLGVLVSGNGSNLQAMLDACALPEFPAEVALVISNVPGAFALERARRAQVSARVLEHGAFSSRTDFERALVDALRGARVEAVCLAGFMRLVGPALLSAFPGKVLNIHPSLLPAFPGLHAVRQALHHGVKLAGCTVHWVDEGTDTGPILAQAAVPVLDDDDERTLGARIQEQEHRLYPLAVRLLASGEASLEGGKVRTTAGPSGEALRNPGT